MCFDFQDNYPRVFEQHWHTARKSHCCCECRMHILPGEDYEYTFGVWPSFGAESYRTCAVCVWFRSRVTIAEEEAGCHGGEATPGFGCLYEALGDGHAQVIGLVDLLEWHEREG